jgi:hypothetical protein
MILPSTGRFTIQLENRASQVILLEALEGYARYAQEKLGHSINSSVLNPIRDELKKHLKGE